MPEPSAGSTPTLVVDIGNTLVRRTKPGLLTRVVEAIAGPTGASDPALRRAVAGLLFTVPDRNTSAARLRAAYPARAEQINLTLRDDDGDAIILPGARELLAAATGAGWRIVAATNAAAGTSGLPGLLADHVDYVAQSCDYGMIKNDPAFWTQLLVRERIDPKFALVVGDSVAADRAAPSAAGLQSRIVEPGGHTQYELAEQITAAGPRPPAAEALGAGDCQVWAGQSVVTTPHLAALVVRVTRSRRYFDTADAVHRGFVVRRQELPPAVLSTTGPLPGVSWLRTQRERSSFVVPAALHSALDNAGLSLDELTAYDHRHAVAMIREARTPQLVAERIDDLIHFLLQRDGGDK